ncbi:alpha/beta hydrolase family protein [Longispora albida]|uniref:alpha/beta hydrolase family protein n=1 Tax=Longispora albida TaxID=203523 RepID=UPI0003654356|nr:alpha/beta hydrolase [Longispora albida]
MTIMDIDLPLGRPGRLHLPGDRPPHTGIVALHPAYLGDREQPIFEHLAGTLAPLGYAVLTYDRRAGEGMDDVPFPDQAADALVALEWLAAEYQIGVGLFGFSQGTWAAAIAAGDNDQVAFLGLLGNPGVSPARQMRYFTDESLRRGGYSEADRAELATLRATVEELLRGAGDRDEAAKLLAEAATKPWFALAYLPPELPEELPAWAEMDYDPAPGYARISCPVTLFYGADEENVPVGPSVAAWRSAGHPDLTVVELPGLGHWPGDFEAKTLSPLYTQALMDWAAGRE